MNIRYGSRIIMNPVQRLTIRLFIFCLIFLLFYIVSGTKKNKIITKIRKRQVQYRIRAADIRHAGSGPETAKTYTVPDY
jgi:hypothetical protein